MICDECRQQDATCQVNVIIGQERIVRHLCRDCFTKLHGNMPGPGGAGVSGRQMAGLLSSILSAITASEGEKTEEKADNTPDLVCPACGTSLRQVKKNGRLGCPECYEAFREEIRPMLQQIHGHVQHMGRHPLDSEEDQKVRSLREELSRKMEEAIRIEDFETAATIRDQLRHMAGEAAVCKT